MKIYYQRQSSPVVCKFVHWSQISLSNFIRSNQLANDGDGGLSAIRLSLQVFAFATILSNWSLTLAQILARVATIIAKVLILMTIRSSLANSHKLVQATETWLMIIECKFVSYLASFECESNWHQSITRVQSIFSCHWPVIIDIAAVWNNRICPIVNPCNIRWASLTNGHYVIGPGRLQITEHEFIIMDIESSSFVVHVQGCGHLDGFLFQWIRLGRT